MNHHIDRLSRTLPGLAALMFAMGIACGSRAAATQAPVPEAARRPNIVLILTDDLGYGELGCYGGRQVPTPNLDRMATEGIRFTQYYSASPICSPSRTGLTTGMFPARWRITSYLQTRAGNRNCQQADFLDPRAPSLARTLKTAGYSTAHIGKWHMGGGRDVTDAPRFAAYGFDEHCSTYESPEPDGAIEGQPWVTSNRDTVRRWNRTAFFVDKTLDFLRRHKGQPCYVNLWPDDTHSPYVPSPERLRAHQGNKFAAVLDEYDRQMGRLLAGIKELGLDDNTLVVFTSDNGAEANAPPVRHGGLRGSKLSLYEGGIRMPLIVRWPGRVPAGRVDEQTVLHAVDFFPSLCALAGAKLPSDTAFDGENLLGALLGTPGTRTKALYWEYGRNGKSFAYPPNPANRSPNVAIREGQWKLLIHADGSRAELYDVQSDPKETDNLALKKPDLTRQLSEKAIAWRRSLPGAPTGRQ